MPWGGPRGGGRPKGVKNGQSSKHKTLTVTIPDKRTAPPGADRPRAERMASLGPVPDIDPLEVMAANMAFYHQQSGELLALILSMPAGDDGDRIEALMRFADMARMRSAAQECARDLAKYRYHPKGAQPYAPPPDPVDAGMVINHENPALMNVVELFTKARAAQPVPAYTNGHNGSGMNGGGHNGTNGSGGSTNGHG